jgi:hypothetical protein
MTGLVRKATLFTACGLLVAAAAMANVPSPANSTAPAYVKMMGTAAGTPDPGASFTVVVRDLANNPIANSQVVLDLANCTDARLCADAIPGLTIDCVTKTVRTFTDGTGSATLMAIGGGTNTGALPGPGAGCARILADGVNLVNATLNIYDENGGVTANGVEVTDLSAFLRDLGTGTYFGRSDFNQLGTVDVVDLAVFLGVFGAGGSSSGCFTVTYCP